MGQSEIAQMLTVVEYNLPIYLGFSDNEKAFDTELFVYLLFA